MFGPLARVAVNFGYAHGHFLSSLVPGNYFHLLLPPDCRAIALPFGVQPFSDSLARSSVTLMHRESELANPLQLLVRKIGLLFLTCSFQMTQTGFDGNAVQFGFGYA